MGVKTIETRSWDTKYRGPLAIHATSRRVMGVSEATSRSTEIPIGDYKCGYSSVLEQYYLRRYIGEHEIHDVFLPLGAIVATCELIDCLPIVHTGEEGAIRTLDIDPNGSLWIVEPEPDEDHEDFPREDYRDVSDQRPYGDFSPGRFAWLLGEVKEVKPPIPMKGKQGLWEYLGGLP